jgi:hypothetical protein
MPRFAEALAITTERLHLTPIEVDDADDLYAILRDPRIGGAMLEESPPSVDVVRSNIVSWLRGPPVEREEAWLNWLVRTHSGTAVGQLAATVQPRGTWLAWIVGVEHQGLGLRERSRARRDRLAQRAGRHDVSRFDPRRPRRI